jgi:hypothetical protein
MGKGAGRTPEAHGVVRAAEARVVRGLGHVHHGPGIRVLGHLLHQLAHTRHPAVQLAVEESLCLAIPQDHLAPLQWRVLPRIATTARSNLAAKARVEGRQQSRRRRPHQLIHSDLHVSAVCRRQSWCRRGLPRETGGQLKQGSLVELCIQLEAIVARLVE